MDEITREVFGGHDYLPEVFDEWVADPAGSFQAIELEGELAGVQRVRPIGPGLALYEGMRVDPAYRRQGVGAAMLDLALAEARGSGFREVRLLSGNPDAVRLFERAGFRRLSTLTSWISRRVEGGEPARVASPADAAALAARARSDPAFELYGGASSYWSAPVDIDETLLGHLAEEGLIRVNGRAFAGLSPTRTDRVGVNFVFGSGGALQDLLMALRFEADADGMEGVWLAAPLDHPAAGDFRAVGYDSRDDSRFGVFALRLSD